MNKVISALLVMSFLFFVPLLSVAQERTKASVAIVYINRAKSSFDDVLDDHIMKLLHKRVDGIYTVVSENKIKETLFKNDAIPSASSVIETAKNDKIDYFVYLQLQPFARKEKVAIFRYGKEMTATVILRIYNGSTGICLFDKTYNAKGTDDQAQVFLEDSIVAWMSIRSKNVGLAAVDEVLYQAGEAISVRLPLLPSGQ
jgi:hypothetical protein